MDLNIKIGSAEPEGAALHIQSGGQASDLSPHGEFKSGFKKMLDKKKDTGEDEFVNENGPVDEKNHNSRSSRRHSSQQPQTPRTIANNEAATDREPSSTGFGEEYEYGRDEASFDSFLSAPALDKRTPTPLPAGYNRQNATSDHQHSLDSSIDPPFNQDLTASNFANSQASIENGLGQKPVALPADPLFISEPQSKTSPTGNHSPSPYATSTDQSKGATASNIKANTVSTQIQGATGIQQVAGNTIDPTANNLELFSSNISDQLPADALQLPDLQPRLYQTSSTVTTIPNQQAVAILADPAPPARQMNTPQTEQAKKQDFAPLPIRTDIPGQITAEAPLNKQVPFSQQVRSIEQPGVPMQPTTAHHTVAGHTASASSKGQSHKSSQRPAPLISNDALEAGFVAVRSQPAILSPVAATTAQAVSEETLDPQSQPNVTPTNILKPPSQLAGRSTSHSAIMTKHAYEAASGVPVAQNPSRPQTSKPSTSVASKSVDGAPVNESIKQGPSHSHQPSLESYSNTRQHAVPTTPTTSITPAAATTPTTPTTSITPATPATPATPTTPAAPTTPITPATPQPIRDVRQEKVITPQPAPISNQTAHPTSPQTFPASPTSARERVKGSHRLEAQALTQDQETSHHFLKRQHGSFTDRGVIGKETPAKPTQSPFAIESNARRREDGLRHDVRAAVDLRTPHSDIKAHQNPSREFGQDVHVNPQQTARDELPRAASSLADTTRAATPQSKPGFGSQDVGLPSTPTYNQPPISDTRDTRGLASVERTRALGLDDRTNLRDKRRTEHDNREKELQPQNMPWAQTVMNIDVAAMDSVKAVNSQDLVDLVKQLVAQITQMSQGGRSETVITLQHPPIFEGTQILLSEFDTAKGEFSLSFHNLSPQAATLILERTNQRLLQQSFEQLGLTMHFYQASQAPIQETFFTGGGQSDNFGNRDREGGHDDGADSRDRRREDQH